MNYDKIKSLAKGTRIISISKYATTNQIAALHNLGQIEFGENRVQDLLAKQSALPDSIKWHFVGVLQKNKINHLIKARPTMWQSCTGLDMALQMDKRLDYKLPTLLQINSSNEPSKQGCSAECAVDEYLSVLESCVNVELVGVMSIGAMSDDMSVVARSFERTYQIYERLQSHGAKWCSMGMSGDFELAIKCGSNMLRLGSIMFDS